MAVERRLISDKGKTCFGESVWRFVTLLDRLHHFKLGKAGIVFFFFIFLSTIFRLMILFVVVVVVVEKRSIAKVFLIK